MKSSPKNSSPKKRAIKQPRRYSSSPPPNAKKVCGKSKTTKPSTKSTKLSTKLPIKSTTLSTETSAETSTETFTKTFGNGLMKDSSYYEQLTPWSFIVAVIDNSQLSNFDYNSMMHGMQLTQGVMNYITKFFIPQKYVNLSEFTEYIMSGSSLSFSLTTKMSFMPYFNGSIWTCYFFNPKKCTFSYITPLNGPTSKCESFFPKFITKYNEDHKNKLPTFAKWKEIIFEPSIEVLPEDSGVYMLYCIKMFTMHNMTDEGYEDSQLRNTLKTDILQYSNDVTELCLKCGNDNDSSVTSSISWTGCSRCKRWIHDTCLDYTVEDDEFLCHLCENNKFEMEIVTSKFSQVP